MNTYGKNENGGAIVTSLLVLLILSIVAVWLVPNFGLFAEDKMAQANVRVGDEVSVQKLKSDIMGDITRREVQVVNAFAQLGQLKAYVNNAKSSLAESKEELAKVTSILKRGRAALRKASGGTLVVGGKKHTSAEVMKSLNRKMDRAENLQTVIVDQKLHLASLESGYRSNIEAVKEAKSKLGDARANLQKDIAILASREELQKVKAMLARFDVRSGLTSSNQSAAQRELNRRMMKIEANTEYDKLGYGLGDDVDWSEEVAPSDVLSRIDTFFGDGLVEEEIVFE